MREINYGQASLEALKEEFRRDKNTVYLSTDGQSALMLVAARLRHVSAITWGTRKYMNMDLLKGQDREAAYSAA